MIGEKKTESQPEVKRGEFSSKLGFVMAAAGSAVGIGNIWSFPTQAADNGGGAFVLLYLFFVLLLGYPMLVAELLVGRHGKGDPVKALTEVSQGKAQTFFSWIFGGGSLLVVSLIFSFYAIVAGWFIGFGLEPIVSFFGLESLGSWLTGFSLSSNLFLTFVFSLLTLFVLNQGVQEGIERWSKRLMPLLLILLVSLAAYLLFLPGAMTGLKQYLIPDFSKILGQDILISALGQSFFSLSLGAAVMMVYGSYLNKKENIPKLAGLVTLLDTLVAILAGLLIIPAIYVAEHNGVKIFNSKGLLIDSDGLVFTVLPALFKTMGSIGFFVVAPFFYLLMTIAALTSSISMLEAPSSFVQERTYFSRQKSLIFVGLSCFFISALIIFNFDSLFGLVVNLVTNYAQPLASLGVVFFVGWVWRRDSVLQELSIADPDMGSSFFWKIWPIYIKVVCPLLVVLVMSQSF